MSEPRGADYDDEYATCAETYSTFRVFSDELGPEQITSILQAAPTKTFCKGDVHAKGKLQRKVNGWFYSTRGQIDSKDTRRHIDAILSMLEGKSEAIMKLHSRGCKMDITSYWLSASGEGGPSLLPKQMLKLGALGISVWWDVYFSDEKQT